MTVKYFLKKNWIQGKDVTEMDIKKMLHSNLLNIQRKHLVKKIFVLFCTKTFTRALLKRRCQCYFMKRTWIRIVAECTFWHKMWPKSFFLFEMTRQKSCYLRWHDFSFILSSVFFYFPLWYKIILFSF